MAITMRGSITYTNLGNVSTATVTKPTGLAANDVCVVEFLLYDGATLRTFSSAPSGWTLMSAISGSWAPSTGGQINLYRYWYRATGSDPASWSWPLTTGTAFIQFQVGTYVGCAQSITPVEFSTATQSTALGSSIVAPSVTLTYANSRLIFVSNNTNGKSYTPPASDGWTEQHEDAGTNNYWADKTQSAAGATGTKTFTFTSGTDPYNGVLIGLIDESSIGGGGTTYTATLTGGITPAGALVKQDRKSLAGGVTPTGALAKQDRKTLAGGLTPTGALAKQDRKSLVGGVTPAGSLATARVVLVSLAGAITPAGAVGRSLLRTSSGAVAPAGALVRRLNRTFTGAATPGGTVVKRLSRALSGALTPAGTLSVLRVLLRSYGGAVAPSGTLARSTAKVVGGAVTPTGAIGRSLTRTLGGALAPAGAVVRAVARTLAGGLTPHGVVATDTFAAGSSGGEPAGYGPTRVVVTSRVRRAVLASSRRVARITSQGG